MFAVQDEITRSIVDALKIKLAVAPPARAHQNTEAYDLYLQGLYLSNKSDEASLRKSISFFQRALDLDPNIVRAWTGIAKAWVWLVDAYVRPVEGWPEVKNAASRALTLDEKDPEAHCYLGEWKRMIERNPSGEEAELKRALEIEPNSAVAHMFMSFVRSAQGDFEQGVKKIQIAEKLDPLSPIIISFAAGVYGSAERFDDAIAAGKRMLQIACYADFRPLRSDPRFADLLQRIGFDPIERIRRERRQTQNAVRLPRFSSSLAQRDSRQPFQAAGL